MDQTERKPGGAPPQGATETSLPQRISHDEIARRAERYGSPFNGQTREEKQP